MKKICKRCGVEHETETQEEMKKFFYLKNHGYFQNICIKCTLKEHAEKYKSGKYNYKKDKDLGYDSHFSIGNFSRCCLISKYDNYPFFNRKRKFI